MGSFRRYAKVESQAGSPPEKGHDLGLMGLEKCGVLKTFFTTQYNAKFKNLKNKFLQNFF